MHTSHWRTLGNSLTLRADIQYALDQTRWLVLEGARSNSLENLCEDMVFIARKLGFCGVHVQLEDGLKKWNRLNEGCKLQVESYGLQAGKSSTFNLQPETVNPSCRFYHPLPGHPGCYLELIVPCPQAGDCKLHVEGYKLKNVQPETVNLQPVTSSPLPAGSEFGACATRCPKSFSITGELLAEGWAKAVATWEKQNQLPLRFDAKETPPAVVTSDKWQVTGDR